MQNGQRFEIGENSLTNREKGLVEEIRKRQKQKADEDAMLEGVGKSWLHCQRTIGTT